MTQAKKKPQTRRPTRAATPAPAPVSATVLPETKADAAPPASSAPPETVIMASDGVDGLIRTGSDDAPSYREPTREDLVRALRAAGQDAAADMIEANARAIADISVDIANDESESEDAEIESEDSDISVDTGTWHQYSHQEVIALIAGALTGKSEEWNREAADESIKGAADRSKMDTLRWGARQLLEIANIIMHVPEGEIVFPVEAAAE